MVAGGALLVDGVVDLGGVVVAGVPGVDAILLFGLLLLVESGVSLCRICRRGAELRPMQSRGLVQKNPRTPPKKSENPKNLRIFSTKKKFRKIRKIKGFFFEDLKSEYLILG